MQNSGMQGSTPSATDAAEVAERMANKLDRLTDTAQQTVERLTNAASQAAGRIGERTQELWEAQAPNVEKARTYMREHPLVTVAVAVGIGIVLSRLLTRR